MILRYFLAIVLFALSCPSFATKPTILQKVSELPYFHNDSSLPTAMKLSGFEQPFSDEQTQIGIKNLALAYRLSFQYMIEALNITQESFERANGKYKKEKIKLVNHFYSKKVKHMKISLDRILLAHFESEAALLNLNLNIPKSKEEGLKFAMNINADELSPTVYSIASKALEFHIAKFATDKEIDDIAFTYASIHHRSKVTTQRSLIKPDQAAQLAITIEGKDQDSADEIRETKEHLLYTEVISSMYKILKVLITTIDSDSESAQSRIKKSRELIEKKVQKEKQKQEKKESDFQDLLTRIKEIPAEIVQLELTTNLKNIKKLNTQLLNMIANARDIVGQNKLPSLKDAEYALQLSKDLDNAEAEHKKVKAQVDSVGKLEELKTIMTKINKLIKEIEKKKEANKNEFEKKYNVNFTKFLKLKEQALKLLSAVQVSTDNETNELMIATEKMASFKTEIDVANKELEKEQKAEQHLRVIEETEQKQKLRAAKKEQEKQERLKAEEEQRVQDELQAKEEQEKLKAIEEQERLEAKEEQERLKAKEEQEKLKAIEEQEKLKAIEEQEKLKAKEEQERLKVLEEQRAQEELKAKEEQERLKAEEEQRAQEEFKAKEEQERLKVIEAQKVQEELKAKEERRAQEELKAEKELMNLEKLTTFPELNQLNDIYKDIDGYVKQIEARKNNIVEMEEIFGDVGPNFFELKDQALQLLSQAQVNIESQLDQLKAAIEKMVSFNETIAADRKEEQDQQIETLSTEIVDMVLDGSETAEKKELLRNKINAIKDERSLNILTTEVLNEALRALPAEFTHTDAPICNQVVQANQ